MAKREGEKVISSQFYNLGEKKKTKTKIGTKDLESDETQRKGAKRVQLM